jgi:4-alpha-glucanotransferase
LDILSRRRRSARLGSLLAVLRALGQPVENLGDVPGALRERRLGHWRQWTEPVCVASAGRAAVALRLPGSASGSLHCTVTLEEGAEYGWTTELADLTVLNSVELEGERYHELQLEIHPELPPGYHSLTLERAGARAEVLLLSPPPSGAYLPRGGRAARTWGVLLPLYALYSDRSWGCGDFGDLEALMDWVSRLGGGVVATLPFLAAYLDIPFEPSPYAPVSRLFWNELFLDVTAIPELKESPTAQSLISSAAFEEERIALQRPAHVDYRHAYALKRRVLEELARTLFERDCPRRAELEQFVASHPILRDYARFRAVNERQRTPWPTWESRLREGGIRDGDFDPAARHYHLYVQWLAHQQLRAFADKARRHGPGLYLDLPLGVHPDGFDVWHFRDAFAHGVSGGAPPDNFFTKGQDWGFPPLHPERIRQQGYRYFIHCLRHHLHYAGILRIDHIMGLHRLFWVPQGRRAIEGVYVRCRAEELYAILALESQRHSAILVGEDLGTVPPAVRPMMARHRVLQSYVAQFEISTEPNRQFRIPVKNSLASLNTHDTPTFAGFWEGLDIEDRVSLGLLSLAEAQNVRENRRQLREALLAYLIANKHVAVESPDLLAVIRGCLCRLAASPARVLSINLEDLWGERHPQNVPGTTTERPNWLRKAKLSLEKFCQDETILATLREVDRLRRSPGKKE